MALVHQRSVKHSVAVNMNNVYINRQNELFRELEILLDLKPSSIGCSLLSLPREIRDQIFSWVLPDVTHRPPELHTCFWGSDMVNGEPWRHEIFGYGDSVPKEDRLPPSLLLINKQLKEEILQNYFRRSNLTLHAELRNTRFQTGHFDFSPHILQLPMLKYVTNIRFYVEWNYTTEKHVVKERRRRDQVRMTDDLLKVMDKIIQPLQAIETIELSVLFFWKHRSGKVYPLSMHDLFDLEDMFKRYAEQTWLTLLRKNKSAAIKSPNPSAGVGYKLSSEKKGTEQSGGMEIFVSQDLEDAMKARRRSNVDFYGHYGISDPLPQPGYKPGAMI